MHSCHGKSIATVTRLTIAHPQTVGAPKAALCKDLAAVGELWEVEDVDGGICKCRYSKHGI